MSNYHYFTILPYPLATEIKVLQFCGRRPYDFNYLASCSNLPNSFLGQGPLISKIPSELLYFFYQKFVGCIRENFCECPPLFHICQTLRYWIASCVYQCQTNHLTFPRHTPCIYFSVRARPNKFGLHSPGMLFFNGSDISSFAQLRLKGFSDSVLTPFIALANSSLSSLSAFSASIYPWTYANIHF